MKLSPAIKWLEKDYDKSIKRVPLTSVGVNRPMVSILDDHSHCKCEELDEADEESPRTKATAISNKVRYDLFTGTLGQLP